MYRYWLAAVFAISVLAISGCNKNEGVLPKMEGKQQSQAPRMEEKKSDISGAERDTYLNTARQEIDQLKNKIDELAVKAKNSSADLKATLETKIRGFQEELQVIEKKWADLKGVSATGWQDMRNALSESIEKLRKAIQRENS